MVTSTIPDNAAPWYNIPVEPVMSVEHPCIVKNSMKGIDMLGGSRSILQTLEAGPERTLALSFNPQDLSSRTVLSLHHQTSNVLLKVTVPKPTGRKRKRGSSDAFQDDTTLQSSRKDATCLLRSMASNMDAVDIEPIGNITSTNVWRNMPDFVFATKGSSFLTEIENKVLPQKYTLLKQYSLPRTYGLEDTGTIPPPVFSAQSLPQNYIYRQNPAVQSVTDPKTGTVSLNTTSSIVKAYAHQWQYDAEVPVGPRADCPPLHEQPPLLQDIVTHLQKLFEERPIWSRRALNNRLPKSDSVYMARHAMAYVAYAARSGPWRDALIKFGVDPRSDPAYRKYQTVLLQLVSKDKIKSAAKEQYGRQWTRNSDTSSHIFDGVKPIPLDGNVWQLCDLEDAQLKSLVEIPDLHIRAECETRYFGWYPNGTLAKIRIALKAKVDALVEGQQLDPDKLRFLLDFPDEYDIRPDPFAYDGSAAAGYVPKGSGLQAIEWAAAYRNVCGTPLGSVPTYGAMGKGRFSQPKPTARPSYIEPSRSPYATETQSAERQHMNIVLDDNNTDIIDGYGEPIEGDGDLEDEEEEEEAEEAAAAAGNGDGSVAV